MKGSLLLLLSAVALTHTAELKTRQTCNCNPNEAWQICDANYDKDNVLIAHEYCDRYYQCANGRPVAFQCHNGLLYNPYTEECDWPQNVDCGDRPISDGQSNDNDDCDDDAGDNGVVDSNEDKDNEGDPDDDGDNDAGADEDCEDSGNDTGNGGNGTCNCDPGEAAAICAADDSNDVLVAHENCNMFYKCDNGKPVAFKCPSDLLYNPKIEECDWPHKVDCGDRVIPDPDDNGNGDNGSGDGGNEDSDDAGSDSDSDSDDNGGSDNGSIGGGNCDPSEAPAICAADGSDGVLIAHENCDKYYICAGGRPFPMPCASGLLFNPVTDKCDHPENVDCGDRIIPNPDDNESGGDNDGGSDNGGSDNDGSDNGGSDNGGSDNGGGGGTCNCNPGEAPGICAADGSDGVLVAHENCNQFYKCAHGIAVAVTCPSGLLYNPYIEKCDWPYNVDCGDRIIPDPEDNDNDGSDNGGSDNGGSDNGGSDNGGSDNGGNDNGPVGGGNCDPSEAPSICAADESEGVLVAHENCNKYYICSGGKPVAMPCPGDLLFNPAIDQCDWPINVDCGDRIISDPDDNENGGDDDGGSDNGGSDNDGSDNGGSDNGGSDNGGGDGTCNCNPEEALGICAADGSDGVLVAHENCNQFYKCAHGIAVALTCPSGLLYNPYIEKCDWPYNVDCGDRIIPDPEDNDNDGSDNGGSDNGGSDNGGSDNGGSDNGGSDNGPVGGGNCDPSEAPSICAADESEGILVAHENCNKYYICSGGKPVAMPCPGDLLFNPASDQCDWPINVDCGDRIIPDRDDNENGGDDDGGSDNGGSDNDGSDNGGSDNGGSDNGGGDGTCNCNPGEAPGICAADGSDGVLVAHENCNQFYKCAHGIAVALTCPSGLLYNPYIEKCDWPYNVDCGDRIIPDPEDNDNDGSDNGGNDNGGSDNGGSDNDGSDNGGNDNGPVGGGNCDPSEAPSICAADESEGVLVAHENCNKYYICSGGKPVAMVCPGDLLFNPAIDQCDWPINVDCGDRIFPDPEDNGNGDNDDGGSNNSSEDKEDVDNDSGSDNGTVGGGNCDPSEAPSICAADESEGVLVAHENCNKYYICSGGKPVAMACPGDLLFNPAIDQCDWPINVDCGDRIIPDPDDNDSEDNDNGGSDNGGSDNGGSDNEGSDNGDGNGTCNCNPEEAPKICAADGSDGVLIAHENCNQFYLCSNGINVAMKCFGDLLFNPYTNKCDWPENVECGDRVIPDPEDNDNDNSDSDNGGGDNDGSDNGAGDNDGSDNGGGNDEDNDNGDSDNGGGGTCNCNPGEAPKICAADGSDGVLIAHENCNQFYICSNGINVALTCFGDLLYNPYTEKCDWPYNVECGDRIIPDPEDNNNEGSDNGGGDNDDNNGDGEDNGGEDNGDSDNGGNDNNNGNDDPSQAPSICAGSGTDGVFIAHENCDQYYMCSGGSPVEFTCSGDLLFNTVTLECDWPRSVDCGDRIKPEEEGCNCNPRRAPALCAAEHSEGVLISHENCNQYYVCAGGVPVPHSCPGALFYNPHKLVCDWPINVDCNGRTATFTSLNKHLESRQTISV